MDDLCLDESYILIFRFSTRERSPLPSGNNGESNPLSFSGFFPEQGDYWISFTAFRTAS